MTSSVKRNRLMVIIVLLSMSLITVGCGTTKTTPTNIPQDATTAPQNSNDDGNKRSGLFQIAGSDTEVNLVQRLTEVYNEQQPDVQFAVTGGGSGTGIAALIDNQIDVANSSRPMKDSEIDQARANGVEPVPFIFAQDGLAVVVNADNPIEFLTMDQIGAIYRGEIKNWNEVGGNDQEISAYGRQSSSGTYVYFMENVVKGDYTAEKKMLSGNANIVEGVVADKAGIGYIGVGYATDGGNVVSGIKVLKVSVDENAIPTSPLELENILQGLYPIVRPLFHYTNGTPDEALKDYLEFVFSTEGQDIVKEEGFFPIAGDHHALNAENIR